MMFRMNEAATASRLGKDMMLEQGQIKICEYVVSRGLKWISVGCGF